MFEVFYKSPYSGKEIVLWTVPWHWLANLVCLTYYFPGSPIRGALLRRKGG